MKDLDYPIEPGSGVATAQEYPGNTRQDRVNKQIFSAVKTFEVLN